MNEPTVPAAPPDEPSAPAPPPVQSPTTEARKPLGPNYTRLWWSSVTSNIGDGVDQAALPLIAVLLTEDPLLFAGVTFANKVPWLLFALQAGAIADRVDRRRLMATVQVVRFILMLALGAAIVLTVIPDSLGGYVASAPGPVLGLLYLVSFALGIAETLYDNAAQAILPGLVDRSQLERANGRLIAGEISTNQFIGPPLGGLLFGMTAAAPILFDAGTFLISAGLLFGISGTYATRRRQMGPAETSAPAGERQGRMTADIREGLAWLWRNRLLRTLAILLGVMNGTAMMGFATFGLFAIGEESILGLGPFGFSLLLTTSALGSLAGSLVAGRVVARFGRGPALWATLVAQIVIQLVIGLTSDAIVVALMMMSIGLAGVIWNVITVSLRQTIIPDDLLGRVNSVYRFLGWGSMPLGSLIGGVAASVWGLRAPWLLGGALMLIATISLGRQVTSPSIEAARAESAN